jgi:hypothetical protein
LLWGEIQVRLSVIRPTIPVRAFEAPGALGCEQPANILRRSNPLAGWEYAEANGRAVAIQRLIGYDSQQASAPFSDQSNINLAYSYSEQPIIHESQASVAPRCLAAASLVRPAPFDPANEFAGIKVDTEHLEIFRVSLPDGKLALVAPGGTTPMHIIVNGFEVQGNPLRYVQMSEDLNEICGLGLTHIAGAVAFQEPATFRLKRTANGNVHIVTNTGFSISDQWLGGYARRVETLTLDNQWRDVTVHCQSNSIPLPLVKEWSGRNQRTLVDFRIST